MSNLHDEEYSVENVDEEEDDEEGLEPGVVGGVDLVAVGRITNLNLLHVMISVGRIKNLN